MGTLYKRHMRFLLGLIAASLPLALIGAEEEESLQRCGKAVETALDTYALISRQAIALNAKSGASHLEDLNGALRLFKRIAELDFV